MLRSLGPSRDRRGKEPTVRVEGFGAPRDKADGLVFVDGPDEFTLWLVTLPEAHGHKRRRRDVVASAVGIPRDVDFVPFAVGREGGLACRDFEGVVLETERFVVGAGEFGGVYVDENVGGIWGFRDADRFGEPVEDRRWLATSDERAPASSIVQASQRRKSESPRRWSVTRALRSPR